MQSVTSAFRVIPSKWAQFKKLNIIVSIEGLPSEHEARRKPATYERILKNISAKVTIHCTITSQTAARSGCPQEFPRFWSGRPEVVKVRAAIDYDLPLRGVLRQIVSHSILPPTPFQKKQGSDYVETGCDLPSLTLAIRLIFTAQNWRTSCPGSMPAVRFQALIKALNPSERGDTQAIRSR